MKQKSNRIITYEKKRKKQKGRGHYQNVYSATDVKSRYF